MQNILAFMFSSNIFKTENLIYFSFIILINVMSDSGGQYLYTGLVSIDSIRICGQSLIISKH